MLDANAAIAVAARSNATPSGLPDGTQRPTAPPDAMSSTLRARGTTPRLAAAKQPAAPTKMACSMRDRVATTAASRRPGLD
jgi:hypothetical protein